MTLISGVLKGPYGDPRSGVTITLRAVRTSSTVLSLAKSQSVTDDSGKYSLPVEAGAYEVIISVYGAQPERVGAIEVYNDSLPGTLNDFLGRPGESDITPEIVQTVDRLRAEAALSADKSAASAAAAKVSEQNAAENSKVVTAAGFASGPVHTADIFLRIISQVFVAIPSRPPTGLAGQLAAYWFYPLMVGRRVRILQHRLNGKLGSVVQPPQPLQPFLGLDYSARQISQGWPTFQT